MEEAFPRFVLWACTCAIALVGIGCSTLLGDFRLADNAADTSIPEAGDDASLADSDFESGLIGTDDSRLEVAQDAARDGQDASSDAEEVVDIGADLGALADAGDVNAGGTETGADDGRFGGGADAPSDASTCDVGVCPCAPLNATRSCDEHPGKDGVGICRAGTQTCEANGWSSCTGYVDPRGRDCSSSLDNDCDGAPDNRLDSSCLCAPGTSAACNTHPGKDGVGPCRAGTQQCMLAMPPSTSAYGACSGDVAPTTDDCQANGADLDCDGIRGDGLGCTTNVYEYGSQPYNCNGGSAQWPTDLFILDTADPAGVPNGYSLIATMKFFVSAGGTKTAVYRCNNTTSGYHFVGFGGCGSGATSERLVGYVSTLNGGNGWVQLASFFGQNFGPTGMIASDNSACCTANCSAIAYYTLR